MILIIGTDSTHTKFFLTAGKSLNIPMFVWSNDFDEVKKLNIDFNLQFVSRELETCLDKASGVLVANRFGEDHFAPAKKVLLAKKPVFVDKPLVINVDQAVELEKLGEKLDVLLMSGSPLNFSEIYAKSLERIGNTSSLKVAIQCPYECNDLGNDPRFQSPFFYGIHALEMALRVRPYEFLEYNYSVEKTQTIINVETDRFSAKIDLLRNADEFYHLSIENNEFNLSSPVPLDGSYYVEQVRYIEKAFRLNNAGILSIKPSVDCVKILQEIEQNEK